LFGYAAVHLVHIASMVYVEGWWDWCCDFVCRDWPEQGHPETPRWVDRVSENNLCFHMLTFVVLYLCCSCIVLSKYV